MKIAEVKRLATEHTVQALEQAITTFETAKQNLLNVIGENEGEQMSHLLAAQFVRKKIDQGMDLNTAIREYSKRVRAILS